MRIWENEDDQLKALLQPCDKDSDQPEDLDRVRKGLENLKEEGRVPERLVYLLVANSLFITSACQRVSDNEKH